MQSGCRAKLLEGAPPESVKEQWNLRRRGLDLASTAEMQFPGTPADQVLAQSPPANANQVAAPKTSLLITVAANPPAFVMPSFIGQHSVFDTKVT